MNRQMVLLRSMDDIEADEWCWDRWMMLRRYFSAVYSDWRKRKINVLLLSLFSLGSVNVFGRDVNVAYGVLSYHHSKYFNLILQSLKITHLNEALKNINVPMPLNFVRYLFLRRYCRFRFRISIAFRFETSTPLSIYLMTEDRAFNAWSERLNVLFILQKGLGFFNQLYEHNPATNIHKHKIKLPLFPSSRDRANRANRGV